MFSGQGYYRWYTECMSPIIYAIFGVLVLGVVALLVLLMGLKKKLETPQESESIKVMADWMRQMKNDTEAARGAMDRNLAETNKQINERLDNAAKYIAGLQGKLGEMTQIGPDIRRLAETLASPKLRGNFGEEMLENMLGQVLPKDSFVFQYRFKNGETVDSVVKIGQFLLPIDSKFSMENYRLLNAAETPESQEKMRSAFRKDVKKRIDEIHKKYILPNEGTFDFALMYVPSEGVYAEVIADSDLTEYTRLKRVIAVGPNSLFAYLQNIIASLRGQEVNKMAQELLAMIQGIRQDSDKVGRHLEVLENHMKNASNSLGIVSTDFVKLKTTITKAASLELEVKPVVEKLLE